MPAEQNREILLPPDTYAYLQKEGNGTLTVHVGPGAINATAQDVPVVYEPKTRSYRKASLDNALQQFPRAAEGEYVILENPSDDGMFPSESNAQPSKRARRRPRVSPGRNRLLSELASSFRVRM